MGQAYITRVESGLAYSAAPFLFGPKKISFSLSGYILQAQIQKEKGLDERRDQNLSDATDVVKFICVRGEQEDGLIDAAATYIYLFGFVR